MPVRYLLWGNPFLLTRSWLCTSKNVSNEDLSSQYMADKSLTHLLFWNFLACSNFLFVGAVLLLISTCRVGFKGGRGGRPPLPYFLQSFVFCNDFEELQTILFTVELIINNASLTHVYLNTIETCLTPNYLFLADSCYNLLTQHQLELRV